jgi:glutamyl-tRNA synthetase
MRVRVRFSPAPTGSLHVGSARTALFNFLFARHHGGTFVLRIEDTDRARSREEWVVGIQDALRWLGLDWDEGPIRQSERFPEYRAAADQLIDSGHVYECSCTPEELEARNAAAREAGRQPGYDGHCRDLTSAQRRARAAEGRPRTLRFRTPDEGHSSFVDEIRGEVRVEWSSIHDFVVVRDDGSPIFFLANAVDDLEMGITHVIRGEDLIDSTHRVLALRAALGGGPPPVYAHLPLILGPDRSKLSKRHGAVALEDFRADGYLPEAVCNYLSLLGWSPDDGREVMPIDEVVAGFTFDGVTHAAAAFDHPKLDWMNGEWIRRLDLPELEAKVLGLAEGRFGPGLDRALLRQVVELGQERSVTLVDLLDQAAFLFASEPFEIGDDAWAKLASRDDASRVLELVDEHLAQCEWTIEGIRFNERLKAEGLARKAITAAYVAIEGRPTGLPLFDSILVLGRERARARIAAARARLDE